MVLRSANHCKRSSIQCAVWLVMDNNSLVSEKCGEAVAEFSALSTAVRLEQKVRAQMQEGRCNDRLYFLVSFLWRQSNKSTGSEYWIPEENTTQKEEPKALPQEERQGYTELKYLEAIKWIKHKITLKKEEGIQAMKLSTLQ